MTLEEDDKFLQLVQELYSTQPFFQYIRISYTLLYKDAVVKKILLLLYIFFIAESFSARAGNTDSALSGKVSQWMNTNSGIRFMENKGQMFDEQRKAVPNVLYEASSGGMNVYVTTSGLSYVFTKYNKFKKKSTVPIADKRHQPDSVTINYCRADMQLVGASIKKENIVQEGESYDRTDYYYGGICPDGILGVHSYTKITIKNIYPGIDWVLHGSKAGLKYDFVVHPGADASLIKLHYKWTDQPQLQPDGSIEITTPMGTITEGTPESFSNNTRVATAYQIKDTYISFKIENYNSTQTLIIDPTLVWATYYGGICNEDVWSMQDDGKNVWLTGEININSFPTFNPGGGAYFQGTSISTNYIAFILKFSIAGVLKWATYYGGSAGNGGVAIYSDGANVWVTGWSDTTLPVYNPGGGAYFQATGSGIYILKFDTAGVREWATYYGKAYPEQMGISIQSDGTNVWLCGRAYANYFPTFNPGNGAYFQGTGASTNLNTFLLKFSVAGILKWATYYSGSVNDNGTSIQSDGTHVWVTGSASSPDFPTFNPGGGAYFQGTLTSTVGNAFILEFDTAGVRQWATYYGGSSATFGDMGNSIYSDGHNVWVTGYTSSPDFPTLNPGGGAYFQGALALSRANAFILQFNTGGVCKWATYYGGSSKFSDIGYSIQSDGNNVWVCGATASKDFPILNPGWGFFQDSPGDSSVSHEDVFILQFGNTGIRKWATYYGSDWENDGSYAWSDGKNLFIAGDATGFSTDPTVNPGGGAYYVDTTDVTHDYENAFIGKFTIACLPHVNISPASAICAGGSTMLTASGALAYSWSPPAGLNAPNIATPIASPTVTTTYTLTSDSNGCMDTNTVTVRVKQLPVANACCDTSIISGQSAHLSAIGAGSYIWSPPTGLSCDTCPNPVALPGQTTTYTLTVTNDSGCAVQSFVTIDILCGNVFVPDVFAPNEGGHNNILYVRGNCIASMNFMVFDRWGNKIFESQNINDGWDGTYKGQPMNPATYIWTLKATLHDGTEIERKGNVTLLR